MPLNDGMRSERVEKKDGKMAGAESKWLSSKFTRRATLREAFS